MSARNLTDSQVNNILVPELHNDPELIGYGPYKATEDVDSLIILLTAVRDGVTPCSLNNIIGPSGAITNATNASPIVITSVAHGRSTGDNVFIQNVGGNTNSNGYFKITVIDVNTFSLNGSAGNAAYTSGGTWNWCVNGIRQQSVSTQSLLGAIDYRDLITNGLATAVTADQYGKFELFKAILNDGNASLVNPDGTDNNSLKTIKQVIGNAHGSTSAVVALSTRTGSRIEQLLNESGIMPTESDIYAAFATGQV